MEYYIIKNKEMPWGDYGNILSYGLLTVMDDNYNDIDIHQIERVGICIPKIYCANSTNLVISEDIANSITRNNITGIEKYHKTEFKKIVNLDWQFWDMKAKDPEIYPKSGEPIDYIEEGENDKKLITQIHKKYFSLKIKESCELEEIDNNLYLIGNPEYDIFIPLNMYFIIVSKRFKEIIESEKVDTLKFIEIQQSN